MTLFGHVKDGRIVLDDPVELPNGAKVQVNVIAPAAATDKEEEIPTLYERMKDFAGIIEGPSDLAENHDHYIHGTPKREKRE